MSETKYFDDLSIGDNTTSASRTITEADIVNFAGLSGDYNPIHIDNTYAEKSPFKQRIAHGLLVLSIASGLFTTTDLNLSMKGSLIALMDVKCQFKNPVFIGDTIHVVAEIKEKKETSKGDRGVIIMERNVFKQNGDIVQKIEATLMMRRKV
ncbi:MAG: MaoC/PaaZ C-terminal domain-containing protein [Spirochaetota bacterium]|nr:MaoC/PaaZ C-terminal domain-containing protein [Spirochaetota bacterium]